MFSDLALLALLVLCASTDLRYKRIPNWLTLPGIALGLGLNLLTGGWVGLRDSALGLAVGFGALFVLFALGWMGGGDVKLMAAIGAIEGYPFVVAALVYSILVGGFLGILVLLWQRRLWRTLKGIVLFMLSRVFPKMVPRFELVPEARSKVPFGIAIVVGTVWALLMSRFIDPLWLL